MYFGRIIGSLDSVARLMSQLVHSGGCGGLVFLVVCHYRCWSWLGARTAEGAGPKILTLDEQPLCSVKEYRGASQPCESPPRCACAATNEGTLLHFSMKQCSKNRRSSPRTVGYPVGGHSIRSALYSASACLGLLGRAIANPNLIRCRVKLNAAGFDRHGAG
jgi:hypothetical protein